ncbi:hypothetical protein [Actinoallomurus sp. NPDC052274]
MEYVTPPARRTLGLAVLVAVGRVVLLMSERTAPAGLVPTGVVLPACA